MSGGVPVKTMAEVLSEHWSASTHTERKPFVDKCDGCGEVIFSWGDPTVTDGSEHLAAHQAAALSAAGFGPVQEARAEVEAAVYPLIRDLIDPEECWFDHHGGCQAHGYLSLKPGEICPQAAAKAWIAAPAAEEADQ